MNHRCEPAFPSANLDVAVIESDVMEIPLLLPGWQVSALETAAHARGLTAAEMVRHVLSEFLSNDRNHSPARRGAVT
jgi:hypothetical protein